MNRQFATQLLRPSLRERLVRERLANDLPHPVSGITDHRIDDHVKHLNAERGLQ